MPSHVLDPTLSFWLEILSDLVGTKQCPLLNADSFPHIIDSILDYLLLSNPVAAITVGTTCRAWRDKIYSRLFSHLTLLIESRRRHREARSGALIQDTQFRYVTYPNSPHTKRIQLPSRVEVLQWPTGDPRRDVDVCSEPIHLPELEAIAPFVRILDIRGRLHVNTLRPVRMFTSLETIRFEETVETGLAQVPTHAPFWTCALNSTPSNGITCHVHITQQYNLNMAIPSLPKPLSHIYLVAHPQGSPLGWIRPSHHPVYSYVPITFVCSDTWWAIEGTRLESWFDWYVRDKTHPVYERGLVRITNEEYEALFGDGTYSMTLQEGVGVLCTTG